ncbi:MAG TPA: toxin-antitoxin system HicB family antitoxin [Myxococcota bacterium]|nr:toxin-antitoxin system HicB family antitoxin [Myxococcota bacterium]
MIPDGYRVVVAYNAESEKFVAKVPELEDVQVSGSTRAEALAGVEEALEKEFHKAAEKGSEMPKPVDTTEFSGEIAVQVSPSLHRELVFEAMQEKVEINQLCNEYLAAAMAARRTSGSHAAQRSGRSQEKSNRRGRRPRQGSKSYSNIMDNKANFMEYVRGQEGGVRDGGRGGNRGRGS